MSKYTRKNDRATVELSDTVQLAVQAFDGHQLSDEDLEVLCDAVLCRPVNRGEEEAKSSSGRVTARFLVTAAGRQSSVIVGVASADEALAKIRQLCAEGLTTVVFDGSGLECSIEDLKAGMAPARSRP